MEDTLLTILNFHNNTVHTSTKHKPIDLRDSTNIELINEVNGNMKKVISKSIKYKELYLLDPNDLLLINTNIKLNLDLKIVETIKKNKKETGSFRFPAIFLKYTKNNK